MALGQFRLATFPGSVFGLERNRQEFLAYSILRVVSGDQCDGWSKIIKESSLPRLKIRHPDVRSIHTDEISSSLTHEAKNLLLNGRLRIVDTELWSLFE